MRTKGDKKLSSVMALAGALSLLAAPVRLYAEGEGQRGAGQSQAEGRQYPSAGQGQSRTQEGLAQQLSREDIRQVQKKLNEMGHDAGPVDGVWGPQTQAAIKNFQQEKEIETTGQLDKRTLEELGVDVQEQRGIMERLTEPFQQDDRSREGERSERSVGTEGSAGQEGGRY